MTQQDLNSLMSRGKTFEEWWQQTGSGFSVSEIFSERRLARMAWQAALCSQSQSQVGK